MMRSVAALVPGRADAAGTAQYAHRVPSRCGTSSIPFCLTFCCCCCFCGLLSEIPYSLCDGRDNGDGEILVFVEQLLKLLNFLKLLACVCHVGNGHFRILPTRTEGAGDVTVSSLGVGTYLGPETDAADDEYVEAMTKALAVGVNVLDTCVCLFSSLLLQLLMSIMSSLCYGGY